MGLFNMFKSRKARESALSPTEATQAQKPVDSTPVGQMFPAQPNPTAFTGANLDLGTIFGMVSQSIKAGGNPQVVIGNANAIQAQGTEMSKQIRDVMSQHGISENMQPGEMPQVSDPQGLQQQIMDVLAQNGLDVGAMTAGAGLQASHFGLPADTGDGAHEAGPGWTMGDGDSGSDAGSFDTGGSDSGGDSGGGDSGGGDSGGGSD